ncbi:unnamed protein product [Mytilus coruscus]|uniref:Saposin B-type domain-containing protein n=1 Tax=Mytilus coruscus TaxID=42192 RepID=A0A6J8D251_MYTCO|nr:unnamed protein product [Mytilus coruscus]
MNVLNTLLLFSCIHLTISESKKEEELSKDVLCAGCEAISKELSKRLSYDSKQNLEKKVPTVLRTVCDEDNFKDTEFSPSKVRGACKQLLKKQKSDITTGLVEHYSKRKQSGSYLDLLQKLCTDVTGVCVRDTETGKPAEGRVIFNDEKQEFEVIMGDNVRMPQPVIKEKDPKNSHENIVVDGIHSVPVKPLKPTMASHDEL